MRLQTFLFAASVLLVSGCSQEKFDDFHHWYDSKPSHMEKKWGQFPTGYFGQNAAGRAVLKPPGREEAEWHQVDNYQAPGGQPMPVMTQNMPGPVDYNESVSVYPLTDEAGIKPRHMVEQPMNDTEVAAAPEAMPVPEPVYSEPMSYGRLENQLYFAHGSARIGTKDHHKLAATAKRAKKHKHVAVTVVGHASHRVNTTDDPVRKKEINFEMAQKRANAVTNVLTHAGVAPDWVLAISKGDDEPNPNPGKRGQEAADRRVEVFMNGKQ